MSEGEGTTAPASSSTGGLTVPAPVAPAASAETRRPRNRRPARPLPWIIGGVVALLALVGTVVALNATLYSPAGFVSRYLSAVERQDLATALEMPGVEVPDGVDTALLVRAATRPVDDARIDSVTERDGAQVVRVEWREGSLTGALHFRIESTGPAFGVFNGWRFAETPVVAVPLTVANATSIRANGVELAATPDLGALSRVDALALAPSALTLDYSSRYLGAAPVTAVAGDDTAPGIVEVQSTPAFARAVQTELDAYLDECATQQVLQPAGCPFGEFVEDRLLAPPSWSMVQYPPVTLAPGTTPDTWQVPTTTGIARISAEVLSLFDGTRAPLEEDVAFDVSYTITIGADGDLTIAGT
ncbi:MAG: hypothetical protein ABWZ77_06070 [Naasia sp.]